MELDSKEQSETKERRKISTLEVLHKSDNFIVINKPFDLILNSDDPNRESVCKALKEQFPEHFNPSLEVTMITLSFVSSYL